MRHVLFALFLLTPPLLPAAASAAEAGGHADAVRGHAAYLAHDWATAESAYDDALLHGLEYSEAVDTAFNLACVRARAGKGQDSVLAALQYAFDVGYDDWDHVGRDPDLASVHDAALKLVADTQASIRAARASVRRPPLPAPDIHATTTSGEPVSLAKWRGSAVLIVVFDSSEPEKSISASDLNLLDQYGTELRFLLVDTAGPDAARQWVASSKTGLPVTGDFSIGISPSPRFVLVDPGGRVRAQLDAPQPVCAIRAALFDIAPLSGVAAASPTFLSALSRVIAPAPAPIDPADPAELPAIDSFASDVPFRVFEARRGGSRYIRDDTRGDRLLGETGKGKPAVRIPPGVTWYVEPEADDEQGIRVALAEVGARRLPGLGLQLDQVPADALSHLGQLRFLDLGRTGEGDALLSWISGLTNLRVLRLPFARVGDAGLASIAGMSHLVELDLSGNEHVGDAGLDALARMNELEVLRLDETGVGDAGVAKLATRTSLRELDLTADRVDSVAPLASLHALERLDLGATRVGDQGISALAGLPALQSLDLAQTEVDDGARKTLAALPKLAELSVAGTRMTGSALTGLASVGRLVGPSGYRTISAWPPAATPARLTCGESVLRALETGELTAIDLADAARFQLRPGDAIGPTDPADPERVRALSRKFQVLNLDRFPDLPAAVQPPEIIPGDLLVLAFEGSPGSVVMVRSWHPADLTGDVTGVYDANGTRKDTNGFQLAMRADSKKALRDPANIRARLIPGLYWLRPLEPTKPLDKAPVSPTATWDAAAAAAALGDKAAAIASLSAPSAAVGSPPLSQFRQAAFDPVRRDPQFRAIAARLGVVFSMGDLSRTLRSGHLPEIVLLDPTATGYECPPCDALERAADVVFPRFAGRATLVRLEYEDDGDDTAAIDASPIMKACEDLPCLARVRPDGSVERSSGSFQGGAAELEQKIESLLK